MSLHLEFEPHSWYKGWAIKKNDYKDCRPKFTSRDSDGTRWFICETHKETVLSPQAPCNGWEPRWSAYTDDGMTYQVRTVEANTLAGIKQEIQKATEQYKEKWGRIYSQNFEALQKFSTDSKKRPKSGFYFH